MVSFSDCNGVFDFLLNGMLPQARGSWGQVQTLTGAQGPWPAIWCPSGPPAAGFPLGPAAGLKLCVLTRGGKVEPRTSLPMGPLLQPAAARRPSRGCSLHMGTCLVLGLGVAKRLAPTRPPTEHRSNAQGREGSTMCCLRHFGVNACLMLTPSMPVQRVAAVTE